MRKVLFSLAAVFAAFATPGFAQADELADRNAAIRFCRAEVVAQTGADEERIRLDQVRVRPRLVRVDLDLWRNGQLQNIRCDVTRGGEAPTIATITPPLQAVVAGQ